MERRQIGRRIMWSGKQIVKSAHLQETEQSYLSQRIYVRVSPGGGTGIPISRQPLRALETVFVANHPDYIAQGGEKRSRLDWCDRCDSYQPVDSMLTCEGCPKVSDYDDFED